MKGDTHIVGGFVASLAVSQVIPHDPFIMMGASVIGSLLPDICHTGSTVGRLFPYISKPINKVFGHRTITHSLLFLVILSFLLDDTAFKAGILAGVIGHYLLDMATKNGIQLFYPLKRRIRFLLTISTGGKMESVVKIGLSVVVFMILFHSITK